MIYRLGINNLTWGLIPLFDIIPEGFNDPRVRVGPEVDENWSPPPLYLYKPRGKGTEPDIWDYDQGQALAVTHEVAASFEGESWCKLFPIRAAVQVGRKPGRLEEIDRLLVATTIVVNVVDAERTQFKPYGDRVLDFDRPGAIVLDKSRLPHTGLFMQPSGVSHCLLATEKFRELAESMGWTGLTFIPIEQLD